MANQDTSSADPEALFKFAEVGLRIDAQLETGAARLANALAEFAATCTEYPLGIDASDAEPLRGYVRRGVDLDLWVRSVAVQFVQADAGAVLSATVEFDAGGNLVTRDDGLAALLQAVLADLPPEVAAQVMLLLDAGDVEGALLVAGVLPITAGAMQSADSAALDGPGPLGAAWDSTRAAIGDGLEQLGGALPNLPQLDPNGPIARQARGEPINPLDWQRELLGYESQTVLAGAPAEIRNARVTVTLPWVGEQTLTAGALVAMALDPTNLIGMGPVEGPTAAILEKALPYLEGPARAAVSRLLRGIAPELAARIIDDAAVAASRTGLGERIMQRSMLKASESSAAAEAVGGLIDYGGIDQLGRPTGIRAVITDRMLGEDLGTVANGDIISPGFQSQKPALSRGHLLGRQLGGSGDVYENLVTLFQNPANTPLMSNVERQVRLAVEAGQKVTYEAVPIYDGAGLMPARIRIRAIGVPVDGVGAGLDLDVTIPNVPKISFVSPALTSAGTEVIVP